MNDLILSDNKNTTMDSREIAELTGKEHRNVIRDIKAQLKFQNIGLLKYEQSYKNSQNRTMPCFKLDYEQTMVLVTGYSIPLRVKVIKRWNELESKEVKIPNQLQLAKQVVTLLEEKEQLLLKSEVADRLVNTSGLYLPSTVGKLITGHSNTFCNYLITSGVMYRKHEKLLPYAKYADKYFKIKVSMFKGRSVEQSYFTPRGLAWVQARYIKSNNLLKLDYKDCLNG